MILDEVHNFRDGGWLEKARMLVSQYSNDLDIDSESSSDQKSDEECSSASSNEEESLFHDGFPSEPAPGQDGGQGYLWCFLDESQINHTFSTGIPSAKDRSPSDSLDKVIRNSKRIFNFAKKFLEHKVKKKLTLGHDFVGEDRRIVRYHGEKQIETLIKELKPLLEQGYSKGDIAILFGNEKSVPKDICSELQDFGPIVDATNNDDDKLVVSTFRKYSGLDRPIVIGVDITASLTPYSLPKACIYCAATRAMVKLVFVEKERN